MRALAILFLLVVGCGDVSPAGVALDGDAGGAAGSGGGGSGGGAAGDTGTGGTGGGADALPPSCDIPIAQVSGVDVAATETRSNGCAPFQGQRVQIVNGAVVNYPNAAEWKPASYTVAPSPSGACAVDIRYERQDATCGLDRLFVTLSVPPI